jgi:hypothetical protein
VKGNRLKKTRVAERERQRVLCGKRDGKRRSKNHLMCYGAAEEATVKGTEERRRIRVYVVLDWKG